MNKQKKHISGMLRRVLIVCLCLIMALGSAVTIMASSFNGDLDGDGKVTSFDAQMLAEYEAGNRDLDPATVIGLTVRGILDRVLGKIIDEPVEDDGNVETTVEVRVDENGFVTKELTFTEENVTVTVPEGVKVTGTELTLTVTKKETSEGGVTAEEGQELLPMDIHVAGVAEDNTVALIICVAGALDTGLNLGNLTVYHVENGELVAMTQVADAAELTVHNSFCYDPATGDVTVAMATFSEVAMVSAIDKAWQGIVATEFAGGAGTRINPYLIANADQLAYMSQLVSVDEAAAEAHYKLIADINMNGEKAQATDAKELMFYPIGYWAKQVDENGVALKNNANEEYYGRGNTFTGTFDGNGNTIANIYQNTWLMDGNYDNGYWSTAMGLFGAVFNATIKNLTVDNFQCDGETAPVGCIATYAGGPDMVFENIQLTNSNPRTYNVACGGIAGYNYNSTSGTADKITFRNITVDQTNKITALWGSYGVSGGSLLGRLRDNTTHDGTNTDGQKNVVYMENCHMATIMDVNNDCCSNYQWYLYCYAGMVIGTVDYIDQVPEVGIEDVVKAVNCTVTYGDWNEYWYCELVKNTIASYTHDHQFGRLTEIDSVREIQDEKGNWNQEGGFVIANADNTEAECFHIFKDSKGYLYRHLHDEPDETNPDVYETTDVDGDGVIDSDLLKEDHQCYYIPFAQLWIGYNRGCSPLYTFEGIEIKDGGTVKSAPKFAAKDVSSVITESTVKLSDLFEAVVDETRISKSALNVFVSPVGEDSTVSAVYAADNGVWGNGTLTFSGTGAAKIVITDYFYCTETVLNVEVEAYDVKFHHAGGMTSVECGANGISQWPEAGAVEGKNFVGWTTALVAETVQVPEFVAEDYKPTEDMELYAVYTWTTEGEAGDEEYVKVTQTPADWSGEYLIVYEAGSLAFNGSLTTLDDAKNNKSVTIVDKKIAATDAMKAIDFTIEASGTSYTIKSASGSYIGNTGTKNGMTVGKADPHTISLNNDGSVAIQASGGTKLQFNSDSNQMRFRYFASTQKAIALYKLKAAFAGEQTWYETITCQHANVSTVTTEATCMAAGSEAVTCLDCGEVFEAVELPAVAHNWVNDVCTKCGNGKAVATNLSQISAGQKVVITMSKGETTWALPNHQGANTPDAITVTVDGDKVVDYNQTLLWNIVKDAEGNLTIYPDGTTEDWLYGNDSNTGVRVGTGDDNLFVVDSNYLKNVAHSRYIGVYISKPDWRCYTSTSTNIANQTLAFYVVGGSGNSGDTDHTHEYNAVVTAPTCTEGGYTTYTCACGDSYTGNETLANGHTEKVGVDNGDGTHNVVCSACSEVIGIEEHDFVDNSCECGAEDSSATEVIATLSFASTAQRTAFSTSQQVWKQNGITLTNDKANATSNVADYANPARFYKNSSLKIEVEGSQQITQIVFDCNSGEYATELKNSISTGSGVTVTVSSDKVTVKFSAGVESFVIAKLAAQVRMDSMTVTYLK